MQKSKSKLNKLSHFLAFELSCLQAFLPSRCRAFLPSRFRALLLLSFFKRERGFTLLELVISFTIMSVIAAIIIVSYGALRSRTDLNGNAQNIISVLNIARSKTISSEGPSQWGAHFETTSYALFKGVTYSASDPNTKIYSLPSSLELVNISLNGGSSNTVFDRITGQTQNYGSVTLRKVNETSNLINITIEQSGQASATTLNQTPANTRVADSRHVHFTYNGDAQNATITLNFPGFLSQDISIPDNTSGGQFSWSGTITVSGSDQVLRMRTHALSGTSADFSVTRDKRYNNAALEIWLNGLSGENLINYTAGGVESQGSSSWVSAPERQ